MKEKERQKEREKEEVRPGEIKREIEREESPDLRALRLRNVIQNARFRAIQERGFVCLKELFGHFWGRSNNARIRAEREMD